MAYTLIDPSEIEPHHGRFRKLTEPLGVSAFSVNHIGIDGGGEGRPHDHSVDGQDEVYVFTEGDGTLVVDGEGIAVRAGQFAFVSPDAYRQLKAGHRGLTWIGLGATPTQQVES